jgi:transcriptional regulator with XRE-family HTH domain
MREHGTNSCYASGCRRCECREAHNAYQRAVRMGLNPSRVPAYPFMEILRTLTQPRMTLHEVATITGVPAASLSRIRKGEYAKIHPDTAEKLRAVLPLLPSGGDAY